MNENQSPRPVSREVWLTRKRQLFLIVIVMLAGAATLLVAIVSADTRDLQRRRDKTRELLNLSNVLRHERLDTVLSRLGQPRMIKFEPPPSIAGRPRMPGRLILTYEYVFGTLPWRVQRVRLHIYIDMDTASVSMLQIYEEYSTASWCTRLGPATTATTFPAFLVRNASADLSLAT